MPGSENFDFRISMSSVLAHTEDHLNDKMGSKEKFSTVRASVEQLHRPLRAGTQANLPRTPEQLIELNGETYIPPVQMLRLHCDVTHDNLEASGNSNIILQIPFMEYYKEAAPIPPQKSRTVNFNKAHLSYTANHQEQHGTFTLMHGYRGLDTVRFWLTDEKNRLVVPTNSGGPVFITLTLYSESCADEVRRHQETYRLLRENTHLTRMLVVQNHDSMGALKYLQAHNEHTDKMRRRVMKYV